MSYHPSQYADYPQHHGHGHHKSTGRRPTPPKPASRQPAPAQKGYTIAHGGRQVRFGPVVFWIISGTIILLGIWSAATATYFTFRDDVLTRLLARQAEMQYAYEDRIADLRAKIDRAASRQLLDQQQFDKKLDQVVRRQSALEARANAISALPDGVVTGSIKPQARATDASGFGGAPKPSPINDTVIFTPPPDRESRLESRSPAMPAATPVKFAQADDVEDTLTRLQASMDRVETRQMATLTSVEESYETRLRRMRGVFSDLGLDRNRMEAAAPRAGMGGPFIPVKMPASASPFDRQLFRISVTRAEMDRLGRTLALIPYRKPVTGPVEFTSGFGIRSDPFLGRPAMHTGLDFRATYGEPVHATANGKVVSAGWAGGYGRMVEIDHGNGLSTRYGHLSAIHVKVGDHVRIGQVVGLVGSTGRSTGPHLHYETRINGEAVDPQRFLRAGVRLAAGTAS